MKKAFLLLLLILLVVLSAYLVLGKAKEPTLDQLTRVDIIEVNDFNETKTYSSENNVISGKEEVDEYITLLREIEWEKGNAEMGRVPDVMLLLHFAVEEGLPEPLTLYQIWFSPEQTATFRNTENARIGKLDAEHANKLQALIIEKGET